MNDTSYLLAADGGGVENNDRFSKITSEELDKQIRELNSGIKKFRKKLIEWVAENKYTIKTTENALDATMPYEEQIFRGTRSLIKYEEQIYEREEFLREVYKDYKKYPYKVQLNNDDVFYLGSNQRAKLQYHILAQNFELVKVDEKEKEDLERFCRNQDTETAQRWFNRMRWEDGHEKIISFGVAIDVRSAKGENGKTTKTKSVWCYSVDYQDTYATFSGVEMQWEKWAKLIIENLDNSRMVLKANMPYDSFFDEAVKSIFYQNGKYLTLTKKEYKTVWEWFYQYHNDGVTPFPYNGKMPNADLQFTIDFEKDIEIVDNIDLKINMKEYNKVHNKEHNREVIGRKKVEQTFSRLVGDEWTRQEILKQGFNQNNLDNFVKYGLIERIKRGCYRRKSV